MHKNGNLQSRFPHADHLWNLHAWSWQTNLCVCAVTKVTVTCRALSLHTINSQKAQQGLIGGYVGALVKPAVKSDIIFPMRSWVATYCDSCSVNFPWLLLMKEAAAARTMKCKTICAPWIFQIDPHLRLESVLLLKRHFNTSSLLIHRCGSQRSLARTER